MFASTARNVGIAMITATMTITSAALALTATIPVDTSWRAIGPVGDLTGQGINNAPSLAWEASHVGWNTLTSFDDSDSAGWKNAVQVIHPNVPFTRYWVDGTETVGSSPAYFRKVFNIPGPLQSGTLDFNVDDDAKIYVNGTLVFDDSDGLVDDVSGLNIFAQLHTGVNLIAVKAHDQQGAQSIQGQLNISYIPEPSTIVLVTVFGLWPLFRRRVR